jgi:hypothetical protein
VFALLAIGLFSHWRFSEWGLNFRNAVESLRILRGFCLVYLPLVVGINVLPALITRHAPPFRYPVTALNMAGWLSFTWLFVGVSEEILFRGLIHSFLARTWTGLWKFKGVAVPHAGLVATVIFCLAHIDPIHPYFAWQQQLWAFGLGLYYSIVYHRTGSLLNPILAHNVSDGLVYSAQLLVYALLKG